MEAPPSAAAGYPGRYVMPVGDWLLLLGAGVLAGVVGTAGGITSLVSYPALLSVGIPALPASVTNVVALVACWPGSALASQPELAGRAQWIRRWAVLAVGGGAAGSALLLSTPSGVFDRIVPFLLVLASVGLMAQPRLSARLDRYPVRRRRGMLAGGLLGVSVYNGYFGAGAGVMVLGLLLVTVDRHTARANALKNMLVGVATVVSAVAYAALGPVHWTAVLPLAVGMFAGSTVGPAVARRVPGDVIRWLAALAGLGLAIWLWR